MDKELFIKFKRAFRMFAREFMFINQNMKYSNLSVIQRHTILEIGEIPGSYLGQIAVSLNIDKGNLSRTINELVHMGYVDRKIDPENRRAVILNLTKDGKIVCNAIANMSKAYFMKVFSYIGNEHLETVVNGLALLSESMHKQNIMLASFINRHNNKEKRNQKCNL